MCKIFYVIVICRLAINFQNWYHATVDNCIPPCPTTLHNMCIEGLRQWSWSRGFWRRGNYCWLCCPCHRPDSISAKSGGKSLLIKLCFSVHSLLVGNCWCFLDKFCILPPSPPVRGSLDLAVHGTRWIRIAGNVTATQISGLNIFDPYTVSVLYQNEEGIKKSILNGWEDWGASWGQRG